MHTTNYDIRIRNLDTQEELYIKPPDRPNINGMVYAKNLRMRSKTKLDKT